MNPTRQPGLKKSGLNVANGGFGEGHNVLLGPTDKD